MERRNQCSSQIKALWHKLVHKILFVPLLLTKYLSSYVYSRKAVNKTIGIVYRREGCALVSILLAARQLGG